ncbi:hypothetical protein J6590_075572 [Homalodisca vitripennis]|nr:hypothetical protein J6590_075572 [Homalodisca vitripennis]
MCGRNTGRFSGKADVAWREISGQYPWYGPVQWYTHRRTHIRLPLTHSSRIDILAIVEQLQRNGSLQPLCGCNRNYVTVEEVTGITVPRRLMCVRLRMCVITARISNLEPSLQYRWMNLAARTDTKYYPFSIAICSVCCVYVLAADMKAQ